MTKLIALVAGLVLVLAPSASAAFDLDDAKDARDDRIEEIKDANEEFREEGRDYAESLGTRAQAEAIHREILFAQVLVTRAILDAHNEVLFGGYKVSHGDTAEREEDWNRARTDFYNTVSP